MLRMSHHAAWPSVFYGGLFVLVVAGPLSAADPTAKPTRATPTRRARLPRRPAAGDGSALEQTSQSAEVPPVNLLESLRTGQVSVSAEGDGQGKMTLSV